MWKPYDSSDREKHLSMVNNYLASLPKSLTASTLHSKKLAFMAEHGIRQLGSPRIGLFADRVKPDPLHCEINAWQHMLDLIYSESVRRCAFDKFIQTLSAPVGLRPHVSTPPSTTEVDETVGSAEYSFDRNDNLERAGSESASLSLEMSGGISLVEMSKKAAAANMSTMLETSAASLSSSPSDIYGCGLSYLSTKVEEHYGDEKKRFNKLSVRLIWAQAVALARYGYHLVDCFQTACETEGEKVRRLALGKIIQYLRNAGGLFNKVYVNNPGEISQLEEFFQLYFNLLALFFPDSVNVTVWTVAYALPFHADI